MRSILLLLPTVALAASPPKPLFADPNYHGSCDPEVVWNTHEKAWWIFSLHLGHKVDGAQTPLTPACRPVAAP